MSLDMNEGRNAYSRHLEIGCGSVRSVSLKSIANNHAVSSKVNQTQRVCT